MSTVEGTPFACPSCGATESWKADYYEAVWQGCTVRNADGSPSVEDYDGNLGHYDDGDTENERIVCRNCDHEIVFGVFRLIPDTDRLVVREETPAGLALRAIQKYDQLVEGVDHRQLLMQACDALGGELGLVCTGEDEGGGLYDHSGDTCPIHEWLVPSDAPEGG